jgi:hypothetical protein
MKTQDQIKSRILELEADLANHAKLFESKKQEYRDKYGLEDKSAWWVFMEAPDQFGSRKIQAQIDCLKWVMK